jgi:hypothetical protein
LILASPDEMVRVSGSVREQNAGSLVPVITQEQVERVSGGGRLDCVSVLTVLANDYWKPGSQFDTSTTVYDLNLQGISYSRDEYELLLLMNVLVEDGSLNLSRTDFAALTVKGLLGAEALGASGSGSQAFVAMWFDPSTNEAWLSGFEPGIKAAGYHPVRLDIALGRG